MVLNADLGESWYGKKVGNDEQLMPLLDYCNIACGFHGGDATTMYKTLLLAQKHQVNAGAHPSYPDRKNFGRLSMDIAVADLKNLLLYQVSALQGMAKTLGLALSHIKPHGALYHTAAYTDKKVAQCISQVCIEVDIHTLFGPPDSYLAECAALNGLTFMAEGFADRAYEENARLRSRRLPHATLSWQEAVDQVDLLQTSQQVKTYAGKVIPLKVQTICIHGDHKGAVDRARAIRELLDKNV